jgi:hypothetical protein
VPDTATTVCLLLPWARTLCSRLCSRTRLTAIARACCGTPRRARRAGARGVARADAQLRWVQALASVTAPVLLVDGYNIIFASRRLARLASLRGLDAARERLVNEVSP